MKKGNIHRYGGILVLFVIAVVFPLFIRGHYHINLMVFIGIYTLLALGLTLLLGYAGQVSMGQAGFYGMGAYVSGVLTAKFGMNPWLALPIAMGITSLLAFFIGFSTLHLKGLYLAMATLGVGIIFHILFVELKDLTGGAIGLMDIPSLSIAGVKLDTDLKFYFLVWFIVLLIFFLITNLVNSRVGRGMRAIQGNEMASNCFGVDSFKYKIKVFILSAALASLSGFLYAHYINFLSPSVFDFSFSILFLTMTIVGGRESIWGALYGATLLTLLPEFLRRYEDLNVMIWGLILVVVLIFFNRGIAGGLDISIKKLESRFRKIGEISSGT
jgi:branched-chain amino acid transport system permease protein